MSGIHTSLLGTHYLTGKKIEVQMVNGRIENIKEIEVFENDKNNHDIIAPGLVDLQVNGFMGIDFNKNPLTFSEWNKVTELLAGVGITTFFPTVITNSYEHLAHLFTETVKNLCILPVHSNIVGGFHLEGPYISPEDGPRGAHQQDFVRAPNWEEFCHLQEKAQGMIQIITLSPEWPEVTHFIQKAVESGVKVAIGHTAATSSQIKEAVQAGAILSTHLGNGAHPTLPRHPNYIWDQLAEDMLWASVISDGHHLPDNVLKVIHQLKKEHMILVSDSVALAGMEPGQYNMPVGGEVTLSKNGRLHMRANKDLLAGSAQHLLQGVQNLVDKKIVGLKEAVHKASIYPAKLLNLPQQKGLQVGAPADLIVVDMCSSKWRVLETYKNGQLIFKERKV
ncbi:N-acetylglucosamine-6-phosphate deacetylase [Gracilibacillus sp. HCP3S3_G5_1]|uniref:N-acetylglucosamine-6-phosphate deacetylase n=1 Tax=unclassified Gracilibacillus TaxID=2625209 RepID=UPI003F8915B1